MISKILYNNNLYIFSLIKGEFLYIYIEKKNLLKKTNISGINNGYHYNLIPHKFENNKIEYIIIYVTYEEKNYEEIEQINFLRYKIIILEEECENKIISNNIFIDQYKEATSLTCQSINSNYTINNFLIICFYSTFYFRKLIASIFDIENNFILINSTFIDDFFFFWK